jgi:hypothetical protein
MDLNDKHDNDERNMLEGKKFSYKLQRYRDVSITIDF